MNRDDITRMAREAGIEFRKNLDDFHSPFCDGIYIDEFERFAALVYAEGHKDGLDDFEAGVLPAAIKAEREACAKVCEQPVDEIQITDDCSEYKYRDNQECADAIRARGQ